MPSIGDIVTVIDYYTASDSAILEELGERLRGLRLRKNITQEALAERTLLSVGTIKSLEAGKGKMTRLKRSHAMIRKRKLNGAAKAIH